jgi:hypothetical protein
VAIDERLLKVAKRRLKAVGDLLRMGLRYNLPNGMSKSVLEYETSSDVSPATVSMDGLRKGRTDQNVFDIAGTPLPLISKDVEFPLRQVAISRAGNTPLPMNTFEDAGDRVAEMAEQMLCGTYGTFAYAGYTLYGYTNFPQRLTYTITAPDSSGWTPKDTLSDVLAMRQLAYNAKHYGPFKLYCSLAWDEYMDEDFSDNKGTNTLRQRLADISNISGVETLDYLTEDEDEFVLVLVQMVSTTVEEIMGMDIRTVQWDVEGGMLLKFKVMAIMIPRLRADQNGNCGIVHGSTS